MKTFLPQLFMVLFIAISSITLKAQNPGESCATAESITSSTTCNYTNYTLANYLQGPFGANMNTNCGVSTNVQDRWFKFTAVATQHTIRIKTFNTNTSLYVDLNILVYDKCSSPTAPFVPLVCHDWSRALNTSEEVINLPTVIGNEYYIMVRPYDNPLPPDLTFDLCITHPATTDLADIRFSSASSSSVNVTNGQPIIVTATLANTGTENTVVPAKMAVMIGYANNSLYSDDRYIGTINFGNINEGDSVTISDTLIVPAGLNNGNYKLKYFADAYDKVTETNSTNNFWFINVVFNNCDVSFNVDSVVQGYSAGVQTFQVVTTTPNCPWVLTMCSGNFATLSPMSGVGTTTVTASFNQTIGENGCLVKVNGGVDNMDLLRRNQSSAAPSADFTASQTNYSGPCPVLIDFLDQSTNSPNQWAWTFSGVGVSPSSSTDQDPQDVTYTQSGTYSVQLSATNTVGNDVEVKQNYITINCATALDEIAKGSVLFATYPNPVTDNLNLKFATAINAPFTVSFINAVGQLAGVKTFDKATAGQVIEIPTASLGQGIYTLVIETTTGRYYTKAVK